MSEKSANMFSYGLLLIGLGAIIFWGQVWPTILLVIGFAVAFRQYLRGRVYDMMITLFVFVGMYVFYFSSFDWDEIMPVLFVTGGVYLILREFFERRSRVGMEEVEAKREEIDEG